MEAQRQAAVDRRRRRLAILGGSVSLFLHVLLLVYLGLVYRGGGGGSGSAGATSFELAVLNEEELTQLEQTTFDELQTESIVSQDVAMESAALTAAAPTAAELSASALTMPTLGGAGAGAGGDIGLDGGGGGGTTSFFGIGSKGNRFAYIIDISGSMGDARKLDIARGELIRSIEALPDYAYFYVLLFNTDFQQPPMQKNWMRARKPLIRQFVEWIKSIDPGGGTAPRSSFMQIYALDVRPDVIYFLTDGIFQDITAEEINSMNRSGKRAVINTIQFGDRSGEEVLRNIARLTGGIYRFVPAEDEF